MPSGSRKGRVKLADIAQASGVSLAAVSLALSDKPGISQETRLNVLSVARTLGYPVKPPTGSNASKAFKTIGLLVISSGDNEPSPNHFYSYIVAGIDATCRQMGFNLMFANLPVDAENCPIEIPALVESSHLDGLIIAGALIDEKTSQILDSRPYPVVLVDAYSQTHVYNSVLTDNLQGAYQATEYLIRKGHTQIGFVGGSDHAYPSFLDRRLGYQKALREYAAGSPSFADCGLGRDEVTSATIELLHNTPQMTAVMGVNDETAIAAMNVLIANGIPVPGQVSVMGFDDIYLAENVKPALTTMRINKQGMGRLAVQLLMNQAAQVEAGCVTSVFAPTLVERDSVAQALPKESWLRERQS